MNRAVAERILFQILLVIVLGVIEVTGRRNLSRDPPVTRATELGLELIADPLRSRQLLR